MQKWADISNYLSPPITEDWVKRCRDEAGIEGFIVQGLYDIPNGAKSQTQRQCETVLSCGLHLAGYVYPFFGNPIEDCTARLATFGEYIAELEDLWLDLEDTSAPNRSYSAKADIVDAWLVIADAYLSQSIRSPYSQAGIYTGLGVWQEMGFPLDFDWWKKRRLYLASYVGTSQLGIRPTFGSFDFDRPLIWQYMGSTSLFGVTGLDLNWTDDRYEADLALMRQYVGNDYWAKFGPSGNNTLKDQYDWPGVCANLEGIISMLESQSAPQEGINAEKALASIRDTLNLYGYSKAP